MTQRNHIRATDAHAWSRCNRMAWRMIHTPELADDSDNDLNERSYVAGQQHEAAVLATYGQSVEARSVGHTRLLKAVRVPVIYQPKFRVFDMSGVPDFLVLDTATDSYRVVDAKYTKNPDKGMRVQIKLSANLAGSTLPPVAKLSDDQETEIGEKTDPLVKQFVRDMRGNLTRTTPPDAHYRASVCNSCPFFENCCKADFEAKGDLGLVYGLDARALPGLAEQGIHTMGDLAATDASTIEPVPYLKKQAKIDRIVPQAKAQHTGEPVLLKPYMGVPGYAVHFDVESNPMADGDDYVYLWGLLLPPFDKTRDYKGFWSDGSDSDNRAAFTQFLAYVDELRQAHPDLKLIHFGSFEITQIRQSAKQFGLDNDPVVQYLLGPNSPLHDLHDDIVEHFALPVVDYGLKSVAKCLGFAWENTESGSMWSIERYLDYLEAEGDAKAAIRDEITTYNRDDVAATAHVMAALAAL